MSRQLKVKRNWIRRAESVTVGWPAVAGGTNVLEGPGGTEDPEDVIAPGARLVRVVGDLSVAFYRGFSVHGAVGFGLARLSLAVPPNGLSLMSAEDADKGWLYREVRTIAARAEYGGTDDHVALTFANNTWRIDWKIHGGRGATIQKDERFTYWYGLWDSDVATVTGGAIPASTGAVLFIFYGWELWEA